MKSTNIENEQLLFLGHMISVRIVQFHCNAKAAIDTLHIGLIPTTTVKTGGQPDLTQEPEFASP